MADKPFDFTQDKLCRRIQNLSLIIRQSQCFCALSPAINNGCLYYYKESKDPKYQLTIELNRAAFFRGPLERLVGQ